MRKRRQCPKAKINMHRLSSCTRCTVRGATRAWRFFVRPAAAYGVCLLPFVIILRIRIFQSSSVGCFAGQVPRSLLATTWLDEVMLGVLGTYGRVESFGLPTLSLDWRWHLSFITQRVFSHIYIAHMFKPGGVKITL